MWEHVQLLTKSYVKTSFVKNFPSSSEGADGVRPGKNWACLRSWLSSLPSITKSLPTHSTNNKLGNAHEVLSCLPLSSDVDTGISDSEIKALTRRRSYLGVGKTESLNNHAARKKPSVSLLGIPTRTQSMVSADSFPSSRSFTGSILGEPKSYDESSLGNSAARL